MNMSEFYYMYGDIDKGEFCCSGMHYEVQLANHMMSECDIFYDKIYRQYGLIDSYGDWNNLSPSFINYCASCGTKLPTRLTQEDMKDFLIKHHGWSCNDFIGNTPKSDKQLPSECLSDEWWKNNDIVGMYADDQDFCKLEDFRADLYNSLDAGEFCCKRMHYEIKLFELKMLNKNNRPVGRICYYRQYKWISFLKYRGVGWDKAGWSGYLQICPYCGSHLDVFHDEDIDEILQNEYGWSDEDMNGDTGRERPAEFETDEWWKKRPQYISFGKRLNQKMEDSLQYNEDGSIIYTRDNYHLIESKRDKGKFCCWKMHFNTTICGFRVLWCENRPMSIIDYDEEHNLYGIYHYHASDYTQNYVSAIFHCPYCSHDLNSPLIHNGHIDESISGIYRYKRDNVPYIYKKEHTFDIVEDDNKAEFCCSRMNYEIKLFEARTLDENNNNAIGNIWYDKRIRQYGLMHYTGDWRLSLLDYIKFCPYCGSKLPRELDEDMRDALHECNVNYHDIGQLEIFAEDPTKIPDEFTTDEWWKKRGL